MKLLINKNTYKGSNSRLHISEDMGHVEAYSYDWWQFVATDEKGNIVFNNTSYSQSTNKHQSDVRDKLRCLGIEVSLMLNYTLINLRDGIDNAVQDEIRQLEGIRENLLAATRKKGSRKAKNKERLIQYEQLGYRVRDLQRYLDIGILPAKPKPSPNMEQLDGVTRDRWQHYFLKPNGVLKRNEFNEFWRPEYVYRNVPNIDRLLNLFDIRTGDLKSISVLLSYRFANDLNGQIPEVDSPYYEKLKKRLARRAESLNTFTLDKLHTYLTNQAIRAEQRDRPVREPIRLPIHPAIERLRDTPDLTILDTDIALRREGRQMHHCIGGKDYLNLCDEEGYQALNYRGYTFLLNSNLNIIQTHGKYNGSTPYHIVEELLGLIKRAYQNNSEVSQVSQNYSERRQNITLFKHILEGRASIVTIQ